MKIKGTINFKQLREKGPSSIDVKDDEIVQLVSRGKDIKYIVNAQHYLELNAMKASLLENAGLKKQETVEIDFNNPKFKKSLEDRFNNLSKVLNDDDSLQVYGCVNNSIAYQDKKNPDELIQSLFDNTEDFSKIKLEHKKVISEYDGPKIFIAEDINTKNIYLGYYKDDERTDNYFKENFFLIKTSIERIKELEDNKKDIYTWCQGHILFLDYTLEYQKGVLPKETIKKTSFNNLVKENAIPDKGVFIGTDPNKEIEEAIQLVENFLKSQMEKEHKKNKKNGKFGGGTANVYINFLKLKKEINKEEE